MISLWEDHQKIKKGILPLVESPGKLVEKGFGVSLPKGCHRKNDSILFGNDAKQC
jgi:hypothetical protein